MCASRRSLNPLLRRSVERSGRPKSTLAFVAGFPHYTHFYELLREATVVATPLTIERLNPVADAVGFPRDEIFLDEATR